MIYVVTVTFTELTTPFVNQRWFFEQAGLKESRLYVINGALMWLSWFVIRIGFVFYAFYLNIAKINGIVIVFAQQNQRF